MGTNIGYIGQHVCTNILISVSRGSYDANRHLSHMENQRNGNEHCTNILITGQHGKHSSITFIPRIVNQGNGNEH